MCTASLVETMAQSLCSSQPAIAIIPWVKPSKSGATIKTWFVFVFKYVHYFVCRKACFAYCFECWAQRSDCGCFVTTACVLGRVKLFLFFELRSLPKYVYSFDVGEEIIDERFPDQITKWLSFTYSIPSFFVFGYTNKTKKERYLSWAWLRCVFSPNHYGKMVHLWLICDFFLLCGRVWPKILLHGE